MHINICLNSYVYVYVYVYAYIYGYGSGYGYGQSASVLHPMLLSSASPFVEAWLPHRDTSG